MTVANMKQMMPSSGEELVAFCKAVGIRRELIVPHNPQQNVVAKRKNHSIE
jgi:hypothetical protein